MPRFTFVGVKMHFPQGILVCLNQCRNDSSLLKIQYPRTTFVGHLGENQHTFFYVEGGKGGGHIHFIT